MTHRPGHPWPGVRSSARHGAQALALTLRHNGLEIGKKDFLGTA